MMMKKIDQLFERNVSYSDKSEERMERMMMMKKTDQLFERNATLNDRTTSSHSLVFKATQTFLERRGTFFADGSSRCEVESSGYSQYPVLIGFEVLYVREASVRFNEVISFGEEGAYEILTVDISVGFLWIERAKFDGIRWGWNLEDCKIFSVSKDFESWK